MDLLLAKGYDDKAFELLHGKNQYSTMLARVKGVSRLVETTGNESLDVWGCDDLLQRARIELDRASQSGESDLFDGLSYVGRVQEWEAAKVGWLMAKGDVTQAAKVGVRMLMEDEYLLQSSVGTVASAVETWSKDVAQNASLCKVIAKCVNASGTSLGGKPSSKRVFFCLDYSGSMTGERMVKANKNMLNIYDNYCYEGDSVGFLR